MLLLDVKTLREVAEDYGIPYETLRSRLTLKSLRMLEGIDFKKLGPRMPILLSPQGIKKLINLGK